jgi:hypothetical protein
MTMSEWIGKLDDFLRLSDRELLKHAGKISHDAAMARAQSSTSSGQSRMRSLGPWM